MTRIYFFSLFLITNLTTQAKTDKFRVIWRSNPTTTAVIAWNQASGTDPILHYSTKDGGVDISKYKQSIKPIRANTAFAMDNKFVRLSGLSPNTTYYFFIQDSETNSRRFYFKTAPDAPDARLSIIAGGDSRNNRGARQNCNRVAGKLHPHCILFNGDFTDGDTDQEWQAWFDDWQLTISKSGHIIPIVPARGNHERSNETLYNLFDIPASNFYDFKIGNLLHFYNLNSLGSVSGDQKIWFERLLEADKTSVFRIAQYHYPIRPHTKHKGNHNEEWKVWATLFNKYQVKLAIESDSHVMKDTYPIRPSTEAGSSEGFIRDDEKGTTYIGEGCWGAPLRTFEPKAWTRDGGSFNHFKWIFIDKTKIEIRNIKTDNAMQVADGDTKNIFAAPTGLDIFKPTTGEVITINAQ
jgi:acid phosphatase type 7